MQITKLLTFLSLTAAVLANHPANELRRDVQQVDCPEGVCFDDAFYCDMEDHKCRRKGGPGPCGSGECLENKDTPAPAPAEPAKREIMPGDNCLDCKLGVEKCKWNPKKRQYECASRYSLGVQGKRGPARSCGKRLADCGRNDNCCSGRCIKNNRFEVGHMTLGSCD